MISEIAITCHFFASKCALVLVGLFDPQKSRYIQPQPLLLASISQSKPDRSPVAQENTRFATRGDAALGALLFLHLSKTMSLGTRVQSPFPKYEMKFIEYS